VVIRTGFETQQGGLMRKILFAAERVTENNAETFKFIGVLLFFACVSSMHVLNIGLRDESRNKFKLVLHCIMIITSVVPPVRKLWLFKGFVCSMSLCILSHLAKVVLTTPPLAYPSPLQELPMELGIAVTSSLAALSKGLYHHPL
jgi:cation-transporting ATPase 13A1